MKAITDEIVNRFKLNLYEEEKSDNTISKYMRDIRFFREWLGVRELEKSSVLEYKKELCMKYAPASINSILSSLNALFAFMDWHDLKVKTLKIQRQIFYCNDRELTKAEYERLLTAAKSKSNERLYYLMQTICSSGIRVSELRHITIEAVKGRQATICCKGKMRVVILPKELCKMLLEYAKRNSIASGAIFITKTGKPIDRSSIWKMMKSLCENADVSKEKVFPHNLRHLFARTFYSLQKDIVRLADILGHSSVNTTRIYTIETGETHRRQIQKLGLLRL
ncbi:MAG: tyrosine-type recombinase/integrase [Clostridia bacterium]|nr:tyrosine-type recombinase/integrase [Clostridia bacterium]